MTVHANHWLPAWVRQLADKRKDVNKSESDDEAPPALDTLDDDALEAEISRLRDELSAGLPEGDAEPDDEAFAALDSVTERLESALAEQESRVAAAEEAEQAAQTRRDRLARMREHAAADGDQADNAEGETVEGDEGDEGDTPAVAASTRPAVRRRVPARPKPPPSVPGVRLTALPGSGVEAEREIDIAMMSQMMADRWSKCRPGDPMVPIARAEVSPAAGRHLAAGGGSANQVVWQRLVEAWRKPEPVLADGGLCAPVTPLYDVFSPFGDHRPVKDSLPSFTADRGGFSLNAPPTLADVDAGVDVITEAEDAASATKPCVDHTCGALRTFETSAVSRCVRFGNWVGRANPEQVMAWIAAAASQHAREADGELLTEIEANATNVTNSGGTGAWRELLARWAQAAAGLRSRNRLMKRAPIDIYVPQWVPDLWVADWARGNDQYAPVPTVEDVEEAARRIGVRLTWYADEATGFDAIFDANVPAADLADFPATVEWAAFIPGTFGFADGGTLDFGITRDATENAANTYTIHVETFERLMFLGDDVVWDSHTVCPTGAEGGAVTTELACPIVAA